MKIAVVCPYVLDRPGGVQTHIRDLAAVQRARGNDVIVVAPPGETTTTESPDLAFFGRRRTVVFNRTQFDLSLAWGETWRHLSTWLDHERFDLIHFHTIWDPFLPLQILSRARGAARVATFHDTPPDTAGGQLTRQGFKLLSRLLAPHLDAVTAVSNVPAGHLRLGPGQPIHIVPPCVDLTVFQRVGAIRRPSPDGRPCRILFLGRLDPRKGVGVLLEAYARLVAEGQNVALTIAGDGVERDAVLTAIDRQRLPGVTLLGGIDEADKAGLYAAADVFCAPSLYGESFGIVLVEAMASGLPVVAAENAGYRAVLTEQRDHCLANPGDAISLADKLRRMIESTALRETLGRWGVAEAPRYDCRAWIETVEAIYADALSRRTRRHHA